MTDDAATVDVAAFYDALAEEYDREFEAPHRRAYDDLAWAQVEELLGAGPARVVDAGCGTGRLSARLVAAGHHVIGLEPAPRMAEEAARRWMADRFELHRVGIEAAELPAGCADLVMAMGSVQFTDDPAEAIRRMARWVRPDGHLVVLCDSLAALVQELLRAGDVPQALERGRTARARWERHGLAVEHHLLDATRLGDALRWAGLEDVRVGGLLVAFTTLGRDEWMRAARDHHDELLALERELAGIPELADTGKQLLAVGRQPVPPTDGVSPAP